MRYNLKLNANILETNILNLFVVIIIVIMVVGENVNFIMQQRRQKIHLILQRIDKELAIFYTKLLYAKRIVKRVCLCYKSIRIQRRQISKLEKMVLQTQLKENIAQLDTKSQHTIQLINRIKVLFVYKQIIYQSLFRIRTILQKNFLHLTKGRILLGNQDKLNIDLINQEFYNIMKFKNI